MYAIVDIETTGGHAQSNGITEIAIIIHDGTQIVKTYQSLVNPQISIPNFIASLTGINDEMVKDAPTFSEIAADVYALLCNRIFVAHNVNFDYSFIKSHLSKVGYALQTKKLCTVRLSRKIIPGKTSYSLGKLCQQMGIPISGRHRAMGDCEATSQLFSMLVSQDKDNHISIALKKNSKEHCLPPNVKKSDFDNLKSLPGVYYFHDIKDKVIYVGKAINIKKRVLSHFSNNNITKQKQNFLRDIYRISSQICGTELMALITEAIEIKKLWPKYNRALKQIDFKIGLYVYADQRNFLRLGLNYYKKFSRPEFTFSTLSEGNLALIKLIKQFNLCHKFTSLQQNKLNCVGQTEESCFGACIGEEDDVSYNERVKQALIFLKESKDSFAIIDSGRSAKEKSCILVENGNFYGMGYVSAKTLKVQKNLKSLITPYPDTPYIINTIHNYGLLNPDKRIDLNAELI